MERPIERRKVLLPCIRDEPLRSQRTCCVKIESIICELHPRHAFRIARPRLSGFRNVFVRVEEDGLCGWGEASPNAFYGETAESVTAKLATVSPHLAGLKIRSVPDVERTWSALWPILAPSRAAQCAVDLALWDLLARRERTSVAELAWDSPAAPVQTFCTIGLSSAEELAQKLQELRGFPMIKIKSDAAADLEPIRTVREKAARSSRWTRIAPGAKWISAQSLPSWRS
jgi:L-alanine-DL-glutamate epimerase-like enolase superfamily enzyme